MSQKANAAIIILVVLIVILLSFAGGGFYLFQKERIRSVALEEKVEEINSKQKISETKLSESEKLITELQQKLKEAKQQVDTLTTDLAQEKSARQETTAKLELLKTDLEQQKTLRSDLEKKLGLAQDAVKKTQEQLKELDSQKVTLESKVKALEAKTQGVELDKIVVSSENAGAAAQEGAQKKGVSPYLEGKVLVVNKDYNFVVINLGSKDGVEMGNLFSVYHKNQHVGDVKVEKVHDSMAAAGFQSQDLKDKVSEGDKVVQKMQ